MSEEKPMQINAQCYSVCEAKPLIFSLNEDLN